MLPAARNTIPELLFFSGGLLWLAFSDPAGMHFSFCPFHYLHVWCPGCGLGRSISWIFRGEISTSFHTHFFGVPALGIILYRIFQLAKNLIITYKNPENYGRPVPA